MSGDNRASALQDDTWLEAVSASLPGIMWTTDRDLRVVTCQGSTQHAFPGRAGLLVRGQLLQELFATADPEYPPLVAHRRALEGEVCPLVFTETDWTFCGRVGPIRWNDEIVGCVALAGELFPCVRHESLAHTIRDLVLFLSPGGEIRCVRPWTTCVRRAVSRSWKWVSPVARDRPCGSPCGWGRCLCTAA